jgi:hypothetical protein
MTLTKDFFKSLDNGELRFRKSERGKKTELVLVLEDKSQDLLGEIKWGDGIYDYVFVPNKLCVKKIQLTETQIIRIATVIRTVKEARKKQ